MELGGAATDVTKALNDLLNHIKDGGKYPQYKREWCAVLRMEMIQKLSERDGRLRMEVMVNISKN
jgi:hypothetical protein